MVNKIRNVQLIELNEAYQKVMYWFFSFPSTETTLNELSERVQISKTTAKRVVTRLEKEGFLLKKVYGKAWSLRCNQTHQYNSTRKVAFNLAMIYESYTKDLRAIIMEKVGNAQSISLFGSYQKGDDTENSDIDIAVEIAGTEELKIVELGTIAQFGYRKNVPINLHVFTRKNIDINLFSNIANGFVLEGFLEVNP